MIASGRYKDQQGLGGLLMGFVLFVTFSMIGVLLLETERLSRDKRALQLMADAAAHAGTVHFNPKNFPETAEEHELAWIKAHRAVVYMLSRNDSLGADFNYNALESEERLSPPLCDPSDSIDVSLAECFLSYRNPSYEIRLTRGLYYFSETDNSAKYIPLDDLAAARISGDFRYLDCPDDAGDVCPSGERRLRWSVANAVSIELTYRQRKYTSLARLIGLSALDSLSVRSLASVRDNS